MIPRKMLPRSSSATSITSSLGGGNSPRSSISDWSESGEGVDYDEWDDLVEGEVPGDSLYGELLKQEAQYAYLPACASIIIICWAYRPGITLNSVPVAVLLR